MSKKIIGCPFCNEAPKLSAYQGTELTLECCQAGVSLQVSDHMTIEEREADSPDFRTCYKYPDKYYERIKDELIDMWNTRPREKLLRDKIQAVLNGWYAGLDTRTPIETMDSAGEIAGKLEDILYEEVPK